MNVFELSAVATPLTGAFVGGWTMKKAGLGFAFAGYGGGFVLGVVFYLAVVGISIGLMAIAYPRDKVEKVPKVKIQSLFSFVSVLAPIASPIACGCFVRAIGHYFIPTH